MISYRSARAADLPAVVAIYNSTIPSRLVTADLEPVTVASRERWFADHQRPARPLWVHERDGEVAAWLSFSSFYGRPAYDGTVEVSVYVHERHRRQGIAAAFIGEARRAAPAMGIHTMLGFIFGHNAPSLALFGRLGFERWGTLPRVAVLDGVERDLVLLGHRLEGPAVTAAPGQRLD
jgi:L-amino acid N-acyltransferase YncA